VCCLCPSCVVLADIARDSPSNLSETDDNTTNPIANAINSDKEQADDTETSVIAMFLMTKNNQRHSAGAGVGAVNRLLLKSLSHNWDSYDEDDNDNSMTQITTTTIASSRRGSSSSSSSEMNTSESNLYTVR